MSTSSEMQKIAEALSFYYFLKAYPVRRTLIIPYLFFIQESGTYS